MVYSKEFKEKVRAQLSWVKDIDQLLEDNDYVIGRYLDDNRRFGISPDKIIEVLEGNDEKLKEEVLAKAKKAKAFSDLYNEWFEYIDREKF